ncbi:hypothetical protein AXF42_Ash018546 [Apostasia shenzhenica]|uniref:Bifunctional lysine-specific demethylase and histidyl-hydroxylase n=1 Tax=Apostasia shenzhenica TaxID=1088818 RepID=A0A2I0APU2_9ASPA|nr:hypothetical protein AXF42_Ash018546 [Apostasia shenzhenica]
MGKNNGSRSKKRKSRTPAGRPPPFQPYACLDLSSFDRTAFPLMLAAAASAAKTQNPSARSLLKGFLRSHLSLLKSSARSPLPSSILLPRGLLSLLPLLLTSSCSSLAALSAEVVGAAALCSLEANSVIVSDREILEGMLKAVRSPSQRVTEAASNALIDLSASPIGRDGLRGFSVTEKLLTLLCQVADSPVGNTTLLHRSDGDNPLALVINVALLLINTSVEGCLGRIPGELSKKVLPLLKELWKKLCSLKHTGNHVREKDRFHSRKHDLAAAIFRLSMNEVFPIIWKGNEVRKAMFGDESFNFENFLLNFWESSPLLIKRASNSLEDKSSIFNSLKNCFGCSNNQDCLAFVFSQLVSCPPIASDELDIDSFLNEAEDHLGSPIIYGQDIRVLKSLRPTSEHMQDIKDEEVHFFNAVVGHESSNVIFQKCQEALHDGYTIALRGMEFRIPEVAAVAEGLSYIFGQPLAGANIYITPPGSQGLAKHYDDHCVFVWQLFGHKKWRISRCSEAFLPRLYEPLGDIHCSKHETSGYMDVLVTEGDILYIPRGFPHEAHTILNLSESQSEAPCEFSIHLTFGIEVEPPFEWEGFVHIALNCWNRCQKHDSGLSDYETKRLRLMLVIFLHVAIRLIADKDIAFRKACMIAALPFRQKATFDLIIERIDTSSSFTETLTFLVKTVHEKNEGSLQWMRWLRQVYQEDVKVNFDNPLQIFEEFLLLYSDHKKEATSEFYSIKSKFCKSVVFEDACYDFNVLLEKYRKTRKQYMKGMLSLHST